MHAVTDAINDADNMSVPTESTIVNRQAMAYPTLTSVLFTIIYFTDRRW